MGGFRLHPMRENPFKVEHNGWPMTVTMREAGDGQYWASVRVGPTAAGVDALLRTSETDLFDDPDAAGTAAAQMGRLYIEEMQAMSNADVASAQARLQAQLDWVNAYVKAYREAAEGSADLHATANDAYRLVRSCLKRDPEEVARAERKKHLEEFATLPKIPATAKRFEW